MPWIRKLTEAEAEQLFHLYINEFEKIWMSHNVDCEFEFYSFDFQLRTYYHEQNASIRVDNSLWHWVFEKIELCYKDQLIWIHRASEQKSTFKTESISRRLS